MNSFNPPINASIWEPTKDNIELCGSYIKSGGIVGMPTETVYGLAANAFDLEACYKIFEYKGRPWTDPLIVHVSSMEMTKDITNIDSDTEALFHLLASHFWPGPFTIVVNANLNKLNNKILANTGTVGIRWPNNKIAQDLIQASGVPIAAPSANKFCHISPVNPYHVMEDFKEFPVKILNGGVSKFCMESTVIKILNDQKQILILRMGAISPADIKGVLNVSNNFKDYTVECWAKKVKLDKEVINARECNDNSWTINQEAPGQFLKHYSPKLQTFLFSEHCEDYAWEIPWDKSIVFVDYMGRWFRLFNGKNGVDENDFLELSKEGNAMEVMKKFYDSLHQAEMCENKKVIVICDLGEYMQENEHKLTWTDRMWKAASFKKVKINW